MSRLTIALLLCAVFPVLAQPCRFSTFINDSLDTYIQDGLKSWDIPGLTIGVVKDGEIIFCEGYGVKSIRRQTRVDSNTLFMIGSLTKAITGATTVLLSESDTLSLNDTIKKWIPDFQLKNRLASKHIIVEDILTGRTGLGSHQGDFLFWKTEHDTQHLLNILSELSPQHQVRQKFIYNNLSYMLLNVVIKRSIGNSWAEAVRDRFFLPLKMNNSYALSSQIPLNTNIASPHLKNGNALLELSVENIDNMGPAGSISSTARDMCQWMMAFMDMGMVDGKRVFSERSMKIIRKPYQLRGYRTRKDNSNQLRFFFSGMGWSIHDEFDNLTYFHDGGTDGFKSFLMVLPERRFGVVVLTNSRSHNFAEAVADELHYALQDEPYQSFSTTYLAEFSEEWQAELAAQKTIEEGIIQVSPETLKAFSGKYANKLYGSVSITQSDSGLTLNFLQHQNQLSGRLQPIGNDSFLCTFSRPEFSPAKVQLFAIENSVKKLVFSAEAFGDMTYEFVKKK
ncbi:MAG: serine hydrolase domain-containing protein [Calditrichia bacterium]